MCGPPKLHLSDGNGAAPLAEVPPRVEQGAVLGGDEFLTFGGLSPLMVGKSDAALDGLADRLESFCAERGIK